MNVCADRRLEMEAIVTAPSAGPWNLYIAPFKYFRGMNRTQRPMWAREQKTGG